MTTPSASLPKVYLLKRMDVNDIEDRGWTEGIYRTPESAMAAYQIYQHCRYPPCDCEPDGVGCDGSCDDEICEVRQMPWQDPDKHGERWVARYDDGEYSWVLWVEDVELKG